MELKPAGKSGKVKAQIGETMLLSRYVAEARRAAKDAENSAQHAETVLINKQDKLVSGVNIKTINDQDVLGSGNIVISGNGSSIVIDSELSDTSVNAVQNRVITGAVREIERALNAPPPIGLGMTGATVGQVPVVKTVDANGVPTSYEPGAGGGGQEIEVSDTEPTNPSVDVWFQEQQQGTPVEVYTVPEIDSMRTQLESNLATIEPTSTVTQKTQYVKGDYLVYNGQLYKVTATTISQGVTLDPTPGSGNIEATSVFTDKLINSDAITTTHQINAVSSVTIGQIFFFNVDLKLTSDISAWTNFATLTGLELESSQYVFGRIGDTMTTFYVGVYGNIQTTMAAQSGKEIRISGTILI